MSFCGCKDEGFSSLKVPLPLFFGLLVRSPSESLCLPPPYSVDLCTRDLLLLTRGNCKRVGSLRQGFLAPPSSIPSVVFLPFWNRCLSRSRGERPVPTLCPVVTCSTRSQGRNRHSGWDPLWLDRKPVGKSTLCPNLSFRFRVGIFE